MKPVERYSYKQKVMALYAGEFYLPADRRDELVSMIEKGMIRGDRSVVQFIDDEGEWLTHE